VFSHTWEILNSEFKGWVLPRGPYLFPAAWRWSTEAISLNNRRQVTPKPLPNELMVEKNVNDEGRTLQDLPSSVIGFFSLG
jgi:hypothetical protein